MLHVSGHDRKALERAVAKVHGDPAITVEEVQPSLEDVFIQLQGQAA
jgi:ABC-2 type transport system ATP-binding protein